MWQNWDGSQSRNHIMFGSIGDYFYNGLAGINPDEEMPGFRKIILTPQFPEDMNYLRCGYRTRFGWVRINWRKERSRIIYELRLPGETLTDFTIPFNRSTVFINGTSTDQAKGIHLRESDPGITNMELTPGHYTLEIELK
jgi:alpha-L-rhamnosidase